MNSPRIRMRIGIVLLLLVVFGTGGTVVAIVGATPPSSPSGTAPPSPSIEDIRGDIGLEDDAFLRLVSVRVVPMESSTSDLSYTPRFPSYTYLFRTSDGASGAVSTLEPSPGSRWHTIADSLSEPAATLITAFLVAAVGAAWRREIVGVAAMIGTSRPSPGWRRKADV